MKLNCMCNKNRAISNPIIFMKASLAFMQKRL